MVVGWMALALALACVGASSQIIGRPVWWLDDQRFSTSLLAIFLILVFAVPLGVALWSMASGPFVPHVSFLGTVELAVLAITERHSSPGSAVVLGTLAVAGLLLSVASFAGLHRLAQNSGEPLDQG